VNVYNKLRIRQCLWNVKHVRMNRDFIYYVLNVHQIIKLYLNIHKILILNIRLNHNCIKEFSLVLKVLRNFKMMMIGWNKIIMIQKINTIVMRIKIYLVTKFMIHMEDYHQMTKNVNQYKMVKSNKWTQKLKFRIMEILLTQVL